MRPITVTLGPLAAASANSIATSQTLSGAGAMTLNGSSVSGGVATLDVPRRVIVTSSGNDSGITFLIKGTDRYNDAQTETITGSNAGAASSALDYATVTSIVSSGASAGNVQAGTSAVASSAWARTDEYAGAPLGGQVAVNGSPTWSIEGSFDDPNSPTNPILPSLMVWQPLQNQTAGQLISAQTTPLFIRVTMTGGTGSLRATFVQYAELSLVQP